MERTYALAGDASKLASRRSSPLGLAGALRKWRERLAA
jgi:hypothetical protein